MHFTMPERAKRSLRDLSVEELVGNTFKALLLISIGWIACSGYYKIPHLWLQENQLTKEELQIKQNCHAFWVRTHHR